MPAPLYVRGLVVGFYETNCYVAGDASSRNVIVIDPGDDSHLVTQVVNSEGLNVVGIVNTHGHADHIGANEALQRQFQCPIMIHQSDAPCLSDPDMNLSAMAGFEGPISPPADPLLRDADEVAAGSVVFRVIHTPGHTLGSICLLAGNALFSGDTLFAGGVGRVDLPGGSSESLASSIREKLLSLADNTLVYPGHGPATTIGRERSSNPCLSDI